MEPNIIPIIMSSVALVGLGVKIAVDLMKAKKSSGNEETTVTGNPHYCLHQEEWGKIKEAIENTDEKFIRIYERLNKIDAKLNSK